MKIFVSCFCGDYVEFGWKQIELKEIYGSVFSIWAQATGKQRKKDNGKEEEDEPQISSSYFVYNGSTTTEMKPVKQKNGPMVEIQSAEIHSASPPDCLETGTFLPLKWTDHIVASYWLFHGWRWCCFID